MPSTCELRLQSRITSVAFPALFERLQVDLDATRFDVVLVPSTPMNDDRLSTAGSAESPSPAPAGAAPWQGMKRSRALPKLPESLPVQDTGVILGISEAPDFVSSRHGGAAAGAGEEILQDPAVESLSSFIGVDGTNTTLNSGRIQINLKPLEEREDRCDATSSGACSRNWRRWTAFTLYMQPVQDLTVEDRVSRTQFQYTLEDADAEELAEWAPRLSQKLQTLPELRDVASDQQNGGLQATLMIDRDTLRAWASRRRRSTTRSTTRSASGRSRPFHAAQPVPRGPGGRAGVSAQTRRRSKNIYVRSPPAAQVPLDRVHALRSTTGAAGDQSSGQFPVGDAVVQSRAGQLARRRRRRRSTRRKKRSACRRASQRHFQGTAQAFQASLANEPMLILAALITVYIVLGILYESYIHPLTILSTLPSAGVGALLALMICRHRFQRHRADRHHSADRHREEERHHDDRLRARRRAQAKA